MNSRPALHDKFQRPVVFDLRVKLSDDADPLAAVLAAIGSAGARVGEVDRLAHDRGATLYEIRTFSKTDAMAQEAAQAVRGVKGVELTEMIDAALESHRGGACEIRSRAPIRSNTDLRIVYTPGVARVCKAIQADPAKARAYTNIANRVAIVTNGTAILGLGDIGPLAGLPVMEGKAAIFWEFAGLSADPVLIDTHDSDEFINIMAKIAGSYGAIQVEDVKAPECFGITRELDRRLDIPVLHDDQHGTATVTLAALYSALAQTGRKIQDVRCVMSGAGAAGTAVADLLLAAGMADVVLCDSTGAICRGRTKGMNPEKQALAERTNRDNVAGSLADAMKGRNLFIGVSQPNIVTPAMVKTMEARPMIFAMANPVSEISRDDALGAGAAVYADGRMINNALAYPGLFRGALDSGVKVFTVEMLMAAAQALAQLVPPGELMPEMMDPATHKAVAAATVAAARQGGGRPVNNL